jgi:hypothetical protein
MDDFEAAGCKAVAEYMEYPIGQIVAKGTDTSLPLWCVLRRDALGCGGGSAVFGFVRVASEGVLATCTYRDLDVVTQELDIHGGVCLREERWYHHWIGFHFEHPYDTYPIATFPYNRVYRQSLGERIRAASEDAARLATLVGHTAL